MGKRRRWLVAIAVVLAVGLGYLAYSLMTRSGAANVTVLTVSQLKTQVEYFNDQHTIVEGKVVPGSIDWDDKAQVISFTLTDDKEKLTVVYEGVVPDYFEPGVELVADGVYRPDGTFEALGFGRRLSLYNLCHS